MKRQFAGIRRKSEFSPNHVGNDLQIISLTAGALRERGHEVHLFDEDDALPDSGRYDLIFSMAQGPAGNRILMKASRMGACIVNTPESVMNCYRSEMVTRLPEHGIPFPRSVVVETAGQAPPVPFADGARKIWVKRGDVHAVHKEDVVLVYSNAERATTLEEFSRRGIARAVLQEHLEGDTVKFYALRNSDFFFWYYLNGITHTAFSQQKLRELAEASARILGLEIYGGDAIIAPDGRVSIIDMNDWPSFAPVRDVASQRIAELLIRKAGSHD